MVKEDDEDIFELFLELMEQLEDDDSGRIRVLSKNPGDTEDCRETNVHIKNKER